MACNEMQEKFQTTAPPGPKEDNQWADFNAQRRIARVSDTSESVGFSEYGGPSTMQMSHNNQMPPGYDITRGQGSRDKFTAISLAGKHDEQNQRESSLNDNTLRNGFFKSEMSPTEDQYTDEHKDDFYDDVGGFVERSNYLDRL